MQRVSWIFIPILAGSLAYLTVCDIDLTKWQLTPQYVTKTIDEAIKEYYEGRTNLLHVRVQLDFSDSWQNKVIDNLAEVLRNSNQMAYIINVQNREDQSANRFYDSNIWYVDSFRALKGILPDFQNYQGNFAGYFMIIMHLTYDNLDPMPVIKQGLKTMNDLQIINVNIAVAYSAGMVVYSYDAFRPDGCLDVRPKIKNYFINGRFVYPELFPEKLTNFYKCKLAILSRNVPPFLSYNATDNQIPAQSMHGIEAEMIKTISSQLNFTPIMTILPAQSWGDVYENGTYTGPFALLSNRTVDVLMGFYSYEPRRILHFSETISYLILPMVAVVNLKRQIHGISPTWMLDPLKGPTWACILILIIGAIIVSNLKPIIPNTMGQGRRHGPKKNSKWLDIIGASLGSSRSISSATNLGTCLWISSWYWGFSIFLAAYSGQLFVAYNHIFNSKPLTLEELRGSNYTYFVRHTFIMDDIFKSDLQVPPNRIKRIHSNNPNDIYELLINSTEKVGTLANKLRIIYYMVNNGYYNDLHTLPEVLRQRQVCAYFRPRSYLLKPFNDIIGILSSNGLISKWHRDTEYQLEKKFYRFQYLELESFPRPLYLSIFSPIFYLHIGLLLISGLVFLCELHWHRQSLKVKQKRERVKMDLKRHLKKYRKPYSSIESKGGLH